MSGGSQWQRPPTPNPSNDPRCVAVPSMSAFRWSRCPVHPWLGVSVLLVTGSPPTCYLEEGSHHLVEVDGAGLRDMRE